MSLPRNWKTVGLLVLVALVTLAAAAPAHAQEGGGEGDPTEGATLYAENCVVCHGEQGEGRAGATLNEVYGGINPDAFFRATISRGVQGTFMPAFSEENGGPLSEEQIDHIVAYIESWGTAVEPAAPAPRRPPQEIPPVPEIDGDPNNGFDIYQVNCVVCHGEDGEGRTGARLTEAFAGIAPDALVVQTIRRGRDGTLMPPFAGAYGGPLSDQEVQDVAAYVVSIQQPSSPRPQGEIVGQASGWPFLAVVAGTLILILALALTLRRSGPEPDAEPDADHH